uniref:CCHC-type domain-containing protein n=1 Tax=Tanacetum cinerariifolium TaxID=118510 RepID=A0A6L2JTE4_TANCI|nr:hypothetical protein [Tanacetum cinerariifolium]
MLLREILLMLLEHQDIVAKFYGPSRWKELSKEMSIKILPCGDGSCWKTESSEFCTRHHDAQKDRASVRAEIEVLRNERLAYEQESIQAREALARSEAYCRVLEARVAVLETHSRRLEWQRQAADDLVVQHIMRTQALEAEARDDTLEDTGDHCTKQIIQIMARTRRGQTPPPTNPNNPNNMTPEAVQTMIDQDLMRNSGGGDGSHSSHAENPRNMHIARPCYYIDFMKCHPLNFKGTEGAVGLTRWIEKMESVFNISGCVVENQVKFATCTLLDATLTWWNSQIRTLGPNAYTMTWIVLKKKMTDKYCLLGKVKKLEIELWNLKVKDNNIPAYTNRFQELALICTKFVSNETEKVDSKRKADDISRNNQQPFKKQNVAKAYNLGSAEKKNYEGNAPKCTKSTGNTNATNNRGGNGPNPKGNGCFECGNPGHFKRDCPKLKNKNGGNGNAQGWVYAMGNAERNGMLRETQTQMSSRVQLGSFDSIIGMDWLRRHHAVIVCDEKLVRVRFGNETLVFHGVESYIERESRLTVISCSKVQEYMAKGCHVFLAQISATKEDDKSEGKRVKDVPIV